MGSMSTANRGRPLHKWKGSFFSPDCPRPADGRNQQPAQATFFERSWNVAQELLCLRAAVRSVVTPRKWFQSAPSVLAAAHADEAHAAVKACFERQRARRSEGEVLLPCRQGACIVPS